MAIGDDYSDILGSDTLPMRQKPTPNSFSFSSKTAVTLALLLAGYIIVARAWRYILKWREKSYRLSLRRRHGIPDNDHRPFNVAYAAVQLAKEQKEKENARLRRADLVAASTPIREASQDQVRHRPGNQRGLDSSRAGAPVGGLPGRYNPTSMNSYLSMPPAPQSQSNRVTFADGFNTSASPLDVHAELASPTKRSGRKSLGILKSGDDRRKRERAYDDEDGDFAKKTRLENDELIDGNEEAEWQDSQSLRNLDSSRVSKRGLGDEDDEDIGVLRTSRGKRQRKVSAEKGSPRHHAMDVDAPSETLKSSSRGKKRDRDEAGSTYGGELEEQDDDAEFNVAEDKAHRKKRRNKRRSDANTISRGKKRDRDLEDELGASDDETNLTSQRILRKKRGKRVLDEEKLSDVSMEDSSSNTSTKGRKIGETWTTNGVQYKIGPNGQRLRFELVKKARQKFVMPIDSVHPDRKANLEVYVEAWLTEEEYLEAKAQHLLSWQESPKSSTEPETPPPSTPTMSSAPRSGKHLLWDSTMNTPPSQPQDNPFETAKSVTQQLATTNTAAASRRIASAVRSTSGGSKGLSSNIVPPSPGLMESTNMRSPRTYKQFSKWEKQDLEAKAMMRMREANRKKEEEQAKESAPSAVPKITLTPAAESGSAPKPPTFSLPTTTATTSKPLFNAPATSSPLAGGEIKAEVAKPSSSATPSFSFAKPSPAPAPTPAPAAVQTPANFGFQNPSTATVPNTNPAKPPAFSFAPPAGANDVAATDKAKPAFGLGFPSSGPTVSPASQPAASSSTTTSNAAPSSNPAPPKFGFNMALKPAAAPEQNKGITSSSDAPSSGGGSLISRLGGTATPSQGNAMTSTAPAFSFAQSAAPSASNAAPSSSASGAAFPTVASSSSPFGGTPLFTTTQQSSQPSAAAPTTAAAAPVKFNFGVNKAASSASSPFGNTDAGKPTMTTTTPSSLSGALNPVPTASNTTNPSPFGSKPQEGSAPPAPKFNFGVNAPSSSAFGVAHSNTTSSPFGSGNKQSEEGSKPSPSPAPIFGSGTPASSSSSAAQNPFGVSQQSTTSTAASSSTPSPFGTSSAFGGNSAFGNGNTASNKNDTSSKSAFAFGSSSNPSPFGAVSTGNNVFGGNPSPFGVKQASSDATKPAAAPSVFAKPSETQSADSPNKAASPFGAPAPASSSTAPSFSFNNTSNAFGTPAAKPAGESENKSAFTFGSSSSAAPASSTPAAASDKANSAFSFGSSTSPAGTPAKTAFSFGTAAAPSGTNNATGSAFAFGTPAGGAQTNSIFGGGSSTPSAFSFGSKPAGSDSAN
ncbi:hypothetical protein C8R42DRAFT_120161 [Lentinula raphanica]|nr:hypothetical protein C8R42DRAFT_120161 [Lentinula raphanica]